MDRTPPRRRPEYLEDEEVTEIRPRRRRRISKDPANPGVNWSLIAGAAMMGLVFTMSMMASAVGVVVATLT